MDGMSSTAAVLIGLRDIAATPTVITATTFVTTYPYCRLDTLSTIPPTSTRLNKRARFVPNTDRRHLLQDLERDPTSRHAAQSGCAAGPSTPMSLYTRCDRLRRMQLSVTLSETLCETLIIVA